jgi:hypothetical protein
MLIKIEFDFVVALVKLSFENKEKHSRLAEIIQNGGRLFQSLVKVCLRFTPTFRFRERAREIERKKKRRRRKNERG